MSHDPITQAVKDKYGQTARSTLSGNHADVRGVAQAFGYTAEELTSIPAEANMALSCGNPVATAHLKPGEVVVDLGSGGGLDVFLAARKVGPTGKAIGIDMTPEMIERARKAAAADPTFANVEFHLAAIDHLPLPDASADVIISNCVINLATDKRAVFREMHRVLKPGGRVAVSDIAAKKEIPDEIRRDVMAHVGCIAGAIPVADYVHGLRDAGFDDVTVIDAHVDLNAYTQVSGQQGCCSPPAETSESESAGEDCCSTPLASLTMLTSSCCTPSSGHQAKAAIHEHLNTLMQKYDINEFAASVKVFALKPA